MKKAALLLCVLCLLSGCAKKDLETVGDAYAPGEPPVAKKLEMTIPEDAAQQVMEGETGSLYFCNSCEIAVETLAAGDIDATLRTLTGHGEKELNLLKTQRDGLTCYECVWPAAGETGDEIGRVMVLSDGNFHYCITMTARAETGAETAETWKNMVDSVKLSEK